MRLIHTIIFFFLTSHFFLYSQETAFFDRNFHHRIEVNENENRREYLETDNSIEIKDYNKYGLFRTGKFEGFTDLKNLDEFIWYNSNRQYDKSPSLKLSGRKGTVTYFDRNGDQTYEQLYYEDNVRYIQIWDSGQSYLKNGTGIYGHYNSDKDERMVRVFEDSLEIETYIVRNQKNDTIYYKTDTRAYPAYGLNTFYQDLASNIDYPKFADLLGLEKKITIQFTVNERGELTDFVPLNNKGLGFEKKAIKKLEKMPKWIPASRNGKNVKTRFQIPLTFQQ